MNILVRFKPLTELTHRERSSLGISHDGENYQAKVVAAVIGICRKSSPRSKIGLHRGFLSYPTNGQHHFVGSSADFTALREAGANFMAEISTSNDVIYAGLEKPNRPVTIVAKNAPRGQTFPQAINV